VLLYWTGHGTDKSFTWLETGEKFTDVQFGETVRKMYENKKYQSMLVCAEPCYSGSVVKAIEGIPLVLGFSAASEDESSYADNYSSELGVWMCDRFTYNLIRLYKGQNYINLLDVYKMLNASTIGSNVKVYNYDYYYDLADVMLWDYFYDFNY
jgi:glycosylphosphatidylinositol transamidase (GPIT) subunit GPI8